MDFTKLFLGDALEGVDLGGLGKLGFNMAEGFDSDNEGRARKKKHDSDSDYGSEEESKTGGHPDQDSTDSEEADRLPPALYNLPGGRKVYEMTSLFVPGCKGSAGRDLRDKMFKFNKAIMVTESGAADRERNLTQAQWTENRRKLEKDLKLAKSEAVQKLQSETTLETVLADFSYLTGHKRTHRQLQEVSKLHHPLIERTQRLVSPVPAKRPRVSTECTAESAIQDPAENVALDFTDYLEEASLAEMCDKFIKVPQCPRQGQSSGQVVLSLTEMKPEQRKRLKYRVRRQIEAQIEQVLPKRGLKTLTAPLKQCYVFMRDFKAGKLTEGPLQRKKPSTILMASNPTTLSSFAIIAHMSKPEAGNAIEDFLSGQKPLFREVGSDEDELINSASSQGDLSQPAAEAQDSHEPLHSDPPVTQNASVAQPSSVPLPSDVQICKWMEEADSQKQRRPLWGETLTCPSLHQTARDRNAKLMQSRKAPPFSLIHDSDSAFAPSQDASRNEEIEIQRLKQTLRVPIRRMNPREEIEGLIKTTDDLHRGRVVNFDLPDQQIQKREAVGNLDNLDVAFVTNINHAFIRFQRRQKGEPQAEQGDGALDCSMSDGRQSSVDPRDSSLTNRDPSFNAEEQVIDFEPTTSTSTVPTKYNVEIVHAACVNELQFTTFEWAQNKLRNIHRPCILSHLASSRSQLPIRWLVSNENPRTRLINSESYFKDKAKLSVKKGEFCLFEHYDEEPLFLSNFGMATQLNCFIYHQGQKASQTLLDSLPHLGPYGNHILRKPQGQIPLIAQINQNSLPGVAALRGLTIAENKLFKAPVFYSQPQLQSKEGPQSAGTGTRDFFCCLQKSPSGQPEAIYLRAIGSLFSVGQQEPKQEVLCPYGRPWYNFNRQRAQTFILKTLQQGGPRSFSLTEAFKMFPKFGEQGLKRMLRDAGIEVDRDQNLFVASTRLGASSRLDADDRHEDDPQRQDFSQLTLEQICSYESALKAQLVLEQTGITQAKYLLADKISAAANRFCADEPSARVRRICRLIEDMVVSAPWNLSNNFLNCRQKGDMLLLEGVGDPSHGYGGYSFLKMPLKVQTDQCMAKAKASRAAINPAIKNPKQVTGTDADLRKLTKKAIKEKLLDLGAFSEEELAKFSRWKMVSMLKEISQRALDSSENYHNRPSSEESRQVRESQATADNFKFIRGERMTTKMQREVYQGKVNALFRRQIAYHLGEQTEQIAHFEGVVPDDLTFKSTSLQRESQSAQDECGLVDQANTCAFTSDQYKGLQKLQQVACFEKLLMHKLPANDQQAAFAQARTKVQDLLNSGEIDFKCQVLKRTIRSVEDGSLRVVYCADEKQIAKFLKRKKSKKATVAQSHRARQQQAAQIMSLKDVSRLQPESSTRQAPDSTVREQGTTSVVINLTGCVKPPAPQCEEPVQPERKASPPKVAINQTRISIQMANFPVSAPKPMPELVVKAAPPLRKEKSVSNLRMQLESDSEDGEEVAVRSRSKKSTRGAAAVSSTTSKKKSASVSARAKRSQKKLITDNSQDSGEERSEFYFQGAAARKEKAASRRAQPSPLETFNKELEDVVDACVKADRFRVFTQRVREKDAPGYFALVDYPMDLSEMKGKAKRRAYQDLPSFTHDVDLLVSNSELYNGPQHQVTVLARNIQSAAAKTVKQKSLDTFELEI